MNPQLTGDDETSADIRVFFYDVTSILEEHKLEGDGYLTRATCARLFIPMVIDNVSDRVIQIDGDTLVVDSLSELVAMNLNGYYAASATMIIDPDRVADLASYCNTTQPSYNVGAIMINIREWKRNNVTELLLSYIKEHPGLPLPDETAINNCIPDKVLRLPLRYNVYCSLYGGGFWYALFCERTTHFPPAHYYSTREIRESRNRPAIHHFVGHGGRLLAPWMEGCAHPYRDTWRKAKALTSWRDAPLEPEPPLIFRARLQKNPLFSRAYWFIMYLFPGLHKRVRKATRPSLMQDCILRHIRSDQRRLLCEASHFGF
jgi:lipopolysaccharide biosynthesis glycosyltransferase